MKTVFLGDTGLLVTDEAKKLLDSGFKGNGCGSGIMSHIACWILIKALQSHPHTYRQLRRVFDVHDAEYSIPFNLRSDQHQIEADSNLQSNARYVLKERTLLAKLMHVALIFKGKSSYYS